MNAQLSTVLQRVRDAFVARRGLMTRAAFMDASEYNGRHQWSLAAQATMEAAGMWVARRSPHRDSPEDSFVCPHLALTQEDRRAIMWAAGNIPAVARSLAPRRSLITRRSHSTTIKQEDR